MQTEEQEAEKQGKLAEGNKNRAPDKKSTAGKVQENSVVKQTLIKKRSGAGQRKKFPTFCKVIVGHPLTSDPASRGSSSQFTRDRCNSKNTNVATSR